MKDTPTKQNKSSWEKQRRDKLNVSFNLLNKLLPSYDPSITVSKIDILNKAVSYIEELHEKIKAMGVQESVPKTMRVEVKTLYGRIKKLIQRNEQLSVFIKDAGIKLPKHYSTKKFAKKLLWSGKISEDKSVELSKKELESQKENQEGVVKKKRIRVQRKRVSHKQNKVQEVDKPRLVANVLPSIIQPSFNAIPNSHIIINTVDSNAAKSAVGNVSQVTTSVTTTTATSAPRVASVICPPTTPNQITNINSIGALGPGTLILPNGSFVRLLPQPPPIIIKPPNNLMVMTTTTSIYTKSFPRIRPKFKSGTKTTQVLKVPIPCAFQRPLPIRKPKKRNRKKLSADTPSKKRTKSNKEVIKPSAESAKSCNESEKQAESVPEKPSPENNKSTELIQDVGEIAPPEKILDEITVSEKILDEIAVSEKILDEIANSEKILQEITDSEKVSQVASLEVVEPICSEANVKDTHLPVEIVEDKTKRPVEIEIGMNLNSELSNDIFSSLQVPIGSQNPESTSPTAAFLMAFPLVSSLTGVKVTEVIEEENSSSHTGTPTLLQIGTIDTVKTTQSESLTPNLLNLDNFSFFSGYSSFDYSGTTTTVTTVVEKVAVTQTENPARTNFNCAQETTSVTYSKTGSVPTPYVQCENQTQLNQEPKHIVNQKQSVQCNSVFPKPPNTYPNNFNSKSYTEPVYTNSMTHYNYNQNHYSNNTQYYLTKSTTTTTYPQYNYYNMSKTTPAQTKEKFSPPKKQNQPKPPINWMTTPDFRGGNNNDYNIPPPSSKELDYNSSNTFYTHANYFNNTNTHDFQQITNFEDNQFSWSPTKLPQYMEAQHGFVATTLPTLIGDLALGTSTLENNLPKKERNKQRVNPGGYDTNPGNFLSVSQLVEHKTDRSTARRNTSRNVKNNPKLKKAPEVPESDKKPVYPNWMDTTCSKSIRHGNKNLQSSNYSAEALIGENITEYPGNRQRYRQNLVPPNKTLPIPTYLSDNIVPPYFPPVEITQENFMTNQNYQNFTQASTYLPDFTPSHDYSNTTTNRPNNDCSLKKVKHKPSNENLSMDFGFLSMPSSINSPILPDDFHSHSNFLPTPNPNQLYPCKNPLYPKQSTDLLSLPPVPAKSTSQQFENMPGSSLTNFNLSTIFPEMNKGSGMYSSEPMRNKNYNFHYLGTTPQTTFHSKLTVSSSSYLNTTATTYAPT